ncbi:MAG TPA: hypothetical protein VEM77_07125 [Thermoplasmata archaeon]|nr:hypothetical protein [Thermoplasmata archaeon]
MADLADLLAKALASPARPRFHAISMGLSFIQTARDLVERLEKRSEEAKLPIAGVRWRGKEAGFLLRSAPAGQDGTGKDVAETRREVLRWLRRINEAARKNRDYARPILKAELERILTGLEAELLDRDALRWTLETPEELDLLRFAYQDAKEGILFLHELGADVRKPRQRLRAFETATRRFLSTETEPRR